MRSIFSIASLLALSVSFVSARPYQNNRAFDSLRQKRQSTNSSSSLSVDLGYSVYQGVFNETTETNSWKGIRFAAAPIGSLRWQPPQTPVVNRTNVIQADTLGPQCPQSGDAPFHPDAPQDPTPTSEDCLYLNVYSPPGATNLPVFVWIHGGGYGAGSARTYDPTGMMNANDNGFVSVIIQYRLGAFGFLSSDEVYRFGAVNAGLLDQHFALQWVQSYIGLFGGNASQVTIAGESAGGGSVMLQDMAYGGTQGTTLFTNTIAASPYIPMQYRYNDWLPSQSYYAYAAQVGCFQAQPYGSNSSNTTTIFACLTSKDTETLQAANAPIIAGGRYGTWSMLPVTDGQFIQQLPSQQLLKRQVNGLNMLSGNNADEGPAFVTQTIQTEDDFVNFLRYTFPLFSDDDLAKILLYYPSSDAAVDPSAPLFPTDGTMNPTAVNESIVGSGQQQRANNLYAETTFVCPSYWMAEAYSSPNHAAYKYQYSIPVATHGSDVSAYFDALSAPAPPNQGDSFVQAFQQIWGNFIMHNDPSISNAVANGVNATNTTSTQNPATAWPKYSNAAPYQINLNQTGGTPSVVTDAVGKNVTQNIGPGLQNDFTLVNAYTWEGGRGIRCDFWRSVGVIVPE